MTLTIYTLKFVSPTRLSVEIVEFWPDVVFIMSLSRLYHYIHRYTDMWIIMRRCSQNTEVQFQKKYLWKLQRFLCPVSRVRRGCNSLFLSVFIYLACKFKCHWLNKNPITLYILDELLIICAGLICIALALIFHASKTIVMFHQLIHLQPNSLTQTNDKIWISSQGKQKIFTSCWIPIMNAIHLLNFSLISRTDCCNWLSWFVFTMSVLWLLYAGKKIVVTSHQLNFL